MSVKALVVYGLGIGCHEEACEAYKSVGVDAKTIHINDLIKSASSVLKDIQILNLAGGFLHGDMLGSAMCASNELANSFIDNKRIIDTLYDFSETGGVIYGQCNGFQLLVKSGLLPQIDSEIKQQVTLAHNVKGLYRVDYVPHIANAEHFAFSGLADQVFHLYCRHGEGRLQINSKFSEISSEKAEDIKSKLKAHAILYYADPETAEPTDIFPHNPNGSYEAIAGLMSSNQRIFGHMAHPEVSIYESRSPNYYKNKTLRARGAEVSEDQLGRVIFANIAKYFA